jgi:copper chaperone CopZ
VEGPGGTDPALTRVRVDGLLCSVCAARVEGALRRLPGVTAVRVDLASGVALVRRRSDVSDADLETAVRRATLFMPLRRLLAWAGGFGAGLVGPLRRVRRGKGRV